MVLEIWLDGNLHAQVKSKLNTSENVVCFGEQASAAGLIHDEDEH